MNAWDIVNKRYVFIKGFYEDSDDYTDIEEGLSSIGLVWGDDGFFYADDDDDEVDNAIKQLVGVDTDYPIDYSSYFAIVSEEANPYV
jgi:hypothetical protein